MSFMDENGVTFCQCVLGTWSRRSLRILEQLERSLEGDLLELYTDNPKAPKPKEDEWDFNPDESNAFFEEEAGSDLDEGDDSGGMRLG